MFRLGLVIKMNFDIRDCEIENFKSEQIILNIPIENKELRAKSEQTQSSLKGNSKLRDKDESFDDMFNMFKKKFERYSD